MSDPLKSFGPAPSEVIGRMGGEAPLPPITVAPQDAAGGVGPAAIQQIPPQSAPRGSILGIQLPARASIAQRLFSSLFGRKLDAPAHLQSLSMATAAQLLSQDTLAALTSVLKHARPAQTAALAKEQLDLASRNTDASVAALHLVSALSLMTDLVPPIASVDTLYNQAKSVLIQHLPEGADSQKERFEQILSEFETKPGTKLRNPEDLHFLAGLALTHQPDSQTTKQFLQQMGAFQSAKRTLIAEDVLATAHLLLEITKEPSAAHLGMKWGERSKLEGVKNATIEMQKVYGKSANYKTRDMLGQRFFGLAESREAERNYRSLPYQAKASAATLYSQGITVAQFRRMSGVSQTQIVEDLQNIELVSRFLPKQVLQKQQREGNITPLNGLILTNWDAMQEMASQHAGGGAKLDAIRGGIISDPDQAKEKLNDFLRAVASDDNVASETRSNAIKMLNNIRVVIDNSDKVYYLANKSTIIIKNTRTFLEQVSRSIPGGEKRVDRLIRNLGTNVDSDLEALRVLLRDIAEDTRGAGGPSDEQKLQAQVFLNHIENELLAPDRGGNCVILGELNRWSNLEQVPTTAAYIETNIQPFTFRLTDVQDRYGSGHQLMLDDPEKFAFSQPTGLYYQLSTTDEGHRDYSQMRLDVKWRSEVEETRRFVVQYQELPISIMSPGYSDIHSEADANPIHLGPDHFLAMRIPEEGRVAAYFEAMSSQGSEVIVSLTEPGENSHHDFDAFPSEVGQTVNHHTEPYDSAHPISITLKTKQTKQPEPPTDGYTYIETSTYEVTMNGETKTIARLHIRNWADHDMPDRNTLIAAHQELGRLKETYGSVLSAHCHGGVGRTGTFLVAEHFMREVDRGMKDVPVASRRETLSTVELNPVATWITYKQQRDGIQDMRGIITISQTACAYAQTAYLGVASPPINPGEPHLGEKPLDSAQHFALERVSISATKANRNEAIFDAVNNLLFAVLGISKSNKEVTAVISRSEPVYRRVEHFLGFDKMPRKGFDQLTEEGRALCRQWGIATEGRPIADIQRDVEGLAFHFQHRMEKIPTLGPFFAYVLHKGNDITEFDAKVRGTEAYKNKYPNEEVSPLQLFMTADFSILDEAYPGCKKFDVYALVNDTIDDHFAYIAEQLPGINPPKTAADFAGRLTQKLKTDLDSLTAMREAGRPMTDLQQLINAQLRQLQSLVLARDAIDDTQSEAFTEADGLVQQCQVDHIKPLRETESLLTSLRDGVMNNYWKKRTHMPEQIRQGMDRFIWDNRVNLLSTNIIDQSVLDTLTPVFTYPFTG